MFHLFRSRRQAYRIMLGVILTPIIITMVITLIPGIFGTGGTTTRDDTVLAQVGGEDITAQEAQFQLQDYVRTQRLPQGAYSFLAPRIVQDLVTDRVVQMEADRLGLTVTEDELAELLRTQMTFLFPDGNFVGKDQYAAFVQERFNKSIPDFEQSLRKDLALVKLRRLVTDGIVVPDSEVKAEFERRNEKVRIEYASISPASLQSSVSSTPAELQDYFQKHRVSYTLPERRSFQYLVIDDAAVASRVKITPEDLQRYYNENRDRFRVQDRVRVTHILFKTTDRTPDEIKKIEAKAQDVLKQVKAGKDFAALAKEYSDDTPSATKGGEIGWVTHGQTVPEFEQKAFSLKPGEVSGLVKTQYGFHIIKVLDRENAHLKTFQEVEPAIRQELARDRGDTEKTKLADAARAAANRHPQDLAAAGRDVGLPVLTAKLLDRSSPVPGVGTDPALADSIFSGVKGSVLGPVSLTGKSVVAVITDVQPSRPAEFSEVAEKVKSDCNRAKTQEAATARAKQLLEKAQSLGGDLKKAAKGFGVDAKTSDLFTRDGSIPGLGSASILKDAFTAPAHSIQGPATAGLDQVVYKITERVPADMSLYEGESKMIRENILSQRQNEAFEIFKDALRERMKKQGKIKMYQDRIDRFIASNRG
ncbi:MAG TPA: peptidyl-prolyl cis-trans isomerase [Bryobacterales bacterium]|nr:peptidyl-prolyl cis-trans isomerase [Bryobacterales bacterium]